MDLSATKFRILLFGFDCLLYGTIIVPLFLSLLGKLQFEFGHFGCNDSSIRLEKRPSSVSKTSLLLFYFLLPFIFILLLESYEMFINIQANFRAKLKLSLKQVYLYYTRYFLWATLNILLNDILKLQLYHVPTS